MVQRVFPIILIGLLGPSVATRAEQLFDPDSAPSLYTPTSLSFGFGSESSGFQDMSLDVHHGLTRESRLFAGIGQSTYADEVSDYLQESYFVGFGTSPLNSVDINLEYGYWDQSGLLTSDTIRAAVEYISPTFSVAVLPELRNIYMGSEDTSSRVGIRNPGLGLQGKLFAMRQLSFEFSRYMYRYSSDTDLLQNYPRRATWQSSSHSNDQFDKRRTMLAASYSFPEWTVSLEWLEGITAADESLYNTLSTVLLWDLNRSWGVQFRLGETTYRTAQEDNATYGNFGFNYRW